MHLNTRLAVVLASIFLTQHAGAASVIYVLDQTNGNPTLADGVNYARVVIDNDTPNALTFTVSMLSPLTSIATANFGIQEFGFNVLGSNPLLDASGSNAQWSLPSSWSANVAPPPNQLDGFGRFDVSVSTTGAVRQSPLVFQIFNTGLSLLSFAKNSTNTAAQGNRFFGTHIAGFDAGNGLTSAYFGGSTLVPPAQVPLFAPMWLLGSGLVPLMAFVRRRTVAA